MFNSALKLQFIHKAMKIHLNIPKIDDTCKDQNCILLESSSQNILKQYQTPEFNLNDHLDEILMERLLIPNTEILFYLSFVYAFIEDEKQKSIYKKNSAANDFMNFLSNLTLNYAFSSLMLSKSAFMNESPKSSLEEHMYIAHKVIIFLQETENYKFIEKIIEQNFDQNKRFFYDLGENICDYLEAMISDYCVIDENGGKIIRIFMNLLGCKLIRAEKIGELLVVDSFDETGVEFNSLIGIVLGFSVFPKREHLILESDYPVTDKIISFISDKRRTKTLYKEFADLYLKYLNESTSLFKFLIRTEQTRSLSFIKTAVSLHLSKSKFEFDTKINPSFTQLSDSFSYNLLSILLEISLPFCNIEDKRIEKIRADYLQCDSQFRSLLKTAIIPSKSLNFTKQDIDGTINHFFYCTLFMLRFGWTTLKKFVSYLNAKKIIFVMEPFTDLKQNHHSLLIENYNMNLLDENRNRKILNFYVFFCDLLLKWNGFEGKLPLNKSSICMNFIPDYILKDYAGFYIYLCNYGCDSIFVKNADGPIDKLITFFTAMISSRELFPNLKVINKYVQVLNVLFKKRILFGNADIFKVNIVGKTYLLSSLIKYYSDLENYQFYGISAAKLHFRKNAFILLRKLIHIEVFSQQLKHIQSNEFFSVFLNYLFGEITTCLEQGLAAVKKMKNLEDEEAKHQDYQEKHSILRATATIYWRQLNKSLSIIYLFSSLDIKVLISEVFIKRFAALLNIFLLSLNGPNYLKLKIKDPGSIKFKTKKTLVSLVKILVAYSKHDSFIESIVTDPRSFNINVYERTKMIISKNHLVSSDLEISFNNLISKLYIANNLAEGCFEDAPDEFLCQITMEIMKNPVKLPDGSIVDKANIERHLLDHNFNPFTKLPLNINDVIELDDLKLKINNYITQTKEARKSNE